MHRVQKAFIKLLVISALVLICLLLSQDRSDLVRKAIDLKASFHNLPLGGRRHGDEDTSIHLTESGLDLFMKEDDDLPTDDGRSEGEIGLVVDTSLAAAVSRKIRLACFITTREVHMETKLKAVNETWGRRCDKMLYVMTTNKTGPDILGLNITDHHDTLTEKIVQTFTHLYTTSLQHYDWFLKADDDSYVIVENLKFFLAHLNSSKPIYVGDHFVHFSPNGYNGGGAGYALSRAALRRLVEQGYRVPGRCRHAGGSEDIETGRCLYKVAVSTYLSVDRYNRSTFHAANPEAFLPGENNFLSGFSATKYNTLPECCSQLTISFHYVNYKLMRVLDMFLYRIAVFGRTVNYKKLKNLFKTREFQIPKERERAAYPGETLEEYYKNATEWRQRNTTIYIRKKAKHN
ncbi:glycoprotein-N-acetylgalactosamine 3-beta-galactosyltransferase 1-B-like [Haliotis rufescens]|uniref:glycoprotein-N-acetylgalactosamine 3-beta-galactosyltransferase 1-B-like n=1 Tax=Haliotis rufescens TaxID=6454 RepID=UPI00201F238B|nr:glycoprotein-N-acetylgalactosamine 3-beta-galactosyltransferase 1-B-like [Haliotis rufescens]